MKTQYQIWIKKFIFTLAIVFIGLSPNANAKSHCPKISKSMEVKLNQRFGQNPVQFAEQFLQAYNSEISNPLIQNKILAASFDLSKIYRANAKNFKSKLITNSLFNWVRTKLTGNLKNSFLTPTIGYLKTNHDLLTANERLNLQNLKPQPTYFKKVLCSETEKQVLGCKKSAYVLSLQMLPEASCKSKKLQKAFHIDFLLTYTKRYGFKLLDVKMSGKRLILDSINMMALLKSKGFNKNAISQRLDLLAQGQTSFKLPKRKVHSGQFLANFRDIRTQEDRVPASL